MITEKPTSVFAEKPYLWVALFYAVLVLVFCYPVLQGKVISQTDALQFISPWDAARPSDLTEPSNPHLMDQSTEFLPFFMEAKSQLSQGSLPLWNPYIFTGTPLWANTQSALLYPLNLFHYVLPPPLGFTISSLLKLFMGCLLTHWFLRQLGLAHLAALLGGVAFGFCAFTVFWLNHPHSNVTPLIPLSFLVAEGMVRSPGLRSMVWCALVVALTLIGGHVEIAFLTACACGLYFFARLIQTGQLKVKQLWFFLVAYLFGLALAAVLIIPFVEFLFNTAIWTERGDTVQFSIPTAGWVNLFMADFFIQDGWQQNSIGYHAFSPYVGVLLWPMVLLAGWRSWHKVWPFLLLALLALAIAFTVNPFHWLISQLPLFNHLPLFYFSVIAGFATTVMAAMGLDAWLKQGVSKYEVLVLVLVVVLLWLVIVWFWQPGGLQPHLANAEQLLAAVRSRIHWPVLLMLLAIGMLLLRYKRTVGMSMVLLLFTDLWLQGQAWNPVVDADLALPNQPESLDYLAEQQQPFRIVAHDLVLLPSTNMLAGLHDVRGYDVPVFDRYHHFFNQVLKGKDAFWYYDLKQFDASILPVLSTLNVQFLLSKRDLSAEIPAYIEPVFAGEIFIYRNHKAKGLAFFADEIRWAPSPDEALSAVVALAAEIDSVTVVEAAPGDQDQAQTQTQTLEQSITYDVLEASRIDLTVKSNKPQWLVLAQSHYPGWHAYIDGEETDIFTANYVLQTIKIPSGIHQVSFQYKPISFTLGWLVSLFSLIIALWIIKKTK